MHVEKDSSQVNEVQHERRQTILGIRRTYGLWMDVKEAQLDDL
jgi:hypothetical protein